MADLEHDAPLPTLVQHAQANGVPQTVVRQAKAAFQSAMAQSGRTHVSDGDGRPAREEAENRFLYEVLRGDGRLHRLRAALEKPRLLTEVPEAKVSC